MKYHANKLSRDTRMERPTENIIPPVADIYSVSNPGARFIKKILGKFLSSA